MTKKWFLPLTYLAIITGSAFGFAPKAMAQTSRTGFFMETYKYAHQHNAAMLEDRPYTAIPLVGNVYYNASTSHPLNAFFIKQQIRMEARTITFSLRKLFLSSCFINVWEIKM